MNKEEILRMSRQENKGKPDEREAAALGQASRVGMAVGGLLCAVLILVSGFFWNKPEMALVGWTVYFAMAGSGNIVLFKHLKARKKLIRGAAQIALAAVFAAATVFKAVA